MEQAPWFSAKGDKQQSFANKGSIVVIVAIVGIVVLIAGLAIYILRTQVATSNPEQAFISPFQLMPYVSHQQARRIICELAVLPTLKQVCEEKYNQVSPDDTEKLDQLFLVLDQAKDDQVLSDYGKFLISQLVFASLPTGVSETAEMTIDNNASFQTALDTASHSLLPEVQAQTSSVSQAEYADYLAENLAVVLENCPTADYENWALNVSCSVHSWINGERQPIYSKTYAESGGPCAFSDAGAAEKYHALSIITTRMKSEQNFVDASGISNQIACSFSCGSYNCPKYEDEFLNPYCSAKGSQNIYVAFPGYKDKNFMDIPARLSQMAAESAHTECEERSFDYVRRSDGTTDMVKARDCKIQGGGRGDWRKDPPDYGLMHYVTYCCSCERPVRDPYISIYNFTDPSYSGGDLIERLLDRAESIVYDPVLPTATPIPDKVLEPTATPPPVRPPDTNPKEEITVLVLYGHHYPIGQFRLADPDECDAKHWHADKTVTSVEGTSGVDPNPFGCGFGKQSEIPVTTVTK